MNRPWILIFALLSACQCGEPAVNGAADPPATNTPAQTDPPPSEPGVESAAPGAGGEEDEDVTPVLAIDTHVDTTQRMLDHGDDISTRLPDGHLDLPRMREGGLTGAFFSIWVNPRQFRGSMAWRRSRGLIGAVTEFVDAHPDVASLCRTDEEVRAAFRDGKSAILMGIEGAHAFGTDDEEVLMRRMRWAYDQGVRYVSPTWSVDSPMGHSSTGESPELGLTEMGTRVIRAMNQMGMIIDVSHVSDQTLRDILRVSTKPVFASHSSVHALADHPRNIPDDLIRGIAAAGGAVCVNFYSQYIDVGYRDRRRAVAARHPERFETLRAEHTGSWISRGQAEAALSLELDPEVAPPDLGTLGAHYEHIVRLGGAGAACLGSDFDGIPELPVGLDDVSYLPALRRELQRRHLPVAPIFGENVLRILAAQSEP